MGLVRARGRARYQHAWPRTLGGRSRPAILAGRQFKWLPERWIGGSTIGCVPFCRGRLVPNPLTLEILSPAIRSCPLPRASARGDEDTSKDGRGHATLAASVYPAASLVTSFLLEGRGE